jgi:hypothetical protein
MACFKLLRLLPRKEGYIHVRFPMPMALLFVTSTYPFNQVRGQGITNKYVVVIVLF